MPRVERAIIMAAGFGNRMHPLTLTTPKPLIRVQGKRMIDTVIEALLKNGIKEIYVVVGYLKEQFADLPLRYPNLTLIENPDYAATNNISSLYAARDHLENAIILDGDQIIYDPGILHPEFERSGYSSIWTEEPTEEWLQTVENGIVTACSRTGGSRGWQLYSLSRWSKKDGRKLKEDLELEYVKKGNRQLYWDDVVMFCHPEDFELQVYPIKRGAIIEVDSLDELIELDPSYAFCKEEKSVLDHSKNPLDENGEDAPGNMNMNKENDNG